MDDIAVDELGAIFVFEEPFPTSDMNVALFSIDLKTGPDIDSALAFLGLSMNKDLKPKYIFGLAYAGGRDYMEVSALELNQGTYICGIERGPHYEPYSDNALKIIAPNLYLYEAKGSVDGDPFTLLPPAEPPFGEEDDDDFDEDEARPRDLKILLSEENFRRVIFLQDAWRQAIDYFPEYINGANGFRPATLKQPVKDIGKYMIPFERQKSNRLWFKNWDLGNFAELNSDWEAFSVLRKDQIETNLSRHKPFS